MSILPRNGSCRCRVCTRPYSFTTSSADSATGPPGITVFSRPNPVGGPGLVGGAAEVSATAGMRAIAPTPIAGFTTFVPGVTENTGLFGAGCGQRGTALHSAKSSHVFMLE